MWLTAGPVLSKFSAWRDIVGLAAVAAAGFGTWAYRAAYIEPRAWGVLCAAADRPLACVPRDGLLWLQREYLWGSIALVLGLWAFLAGGPRFVAVAAMAVGIAGVENYNATWGMLGAALGAWGWLRQGKQEAVLF
jgi:hypothetical protein